MENPFLSLIFTNSINFSFFTVRFLIAKSLNIPPGIAIFFFGFIKKKKLSKQSCRKILYTTPYSRTIYRLSYNVIFDDAILYNFNNTSSFWLCVFSKKKTLLTLLFEYILTTRTHPRLYEHFPHFPFAFFQQNTHTVAQIFIHEKLVNKQRQNIVAIIGETDIFILILILLFHRAFYHTERIDENKIRKKKKC